MVTNFANVMKKHLLVLLLLLPMMFTLLQPARAGTPAEVVAAPLRVDMDAYLLINEVNALRAVNGLAAYSISPTLMSIAQQHAEFMSVNGVSHTGYGGTRPYQRALNAGYPLAGDLTLGGFFSENITAGTNKSVQQAVQEWQGDAPHLNTMLSPNLTEIGAGVAIVGNYVYYVIDCASPISGNAPSAGPTLPDGTPAPIVTQPPVAVNTLLPNTPDADGKVYHTVQKGETLWLIAISYNVKIADIRKLNGLAENADIYPNTKLLIILVSTPTPAPSGTPTRFPTVIPQVTWTVSPVIENATSTPAPVKFAAAETSDSLPVLGVIALAALVLAGILAASTRVRR